MQTAAQAAQTAQRNLASPPSTGYAKPAASTPMADKFWLRMAEMYGLRWTSAYGDKPTELWLKALSGWSADEIRAGLNACLKREDSWPPTLPEFAKMCKPNRESSAMYRNQPRLPAPVSAPEVARAYLDTMKSKVRAVLAADAAKPKPAVHAEGIDDYAWFASRPGKWDADAPLRDRGIVR